MRNSKTVVEELVRKHPGITRYELARALDMRPASVLRILRELRSEGKVLMKQTHTMKDRRDKDFMTG